MLGTWPVGAKFFSPGAGPAYDPPMRPMRSTASHALTVGTLLLLTAGCGDDAGAGADAQPTPDARPVDLTCLDTDPSLTAFERGVIGMAADSWMEVPSTAFEPFCRANGLIETAGEDAYRCVGVITAWGGAVYDSGERQLLVWGGGHNDYAGNEVYGFDLRAGAWRVIKPPTPLAQVTTNENVYADGNPPSVHSYDGFAYLPDRRRMFHYGGSRYQDGSSTNGTWLFDPVAAAWERRADYDQGTGSGLFYGATDYDPVTGKVFSRTQDGLFTYSVADDVWARLADFGYEPYWPTYANSNYRRGVMVGARRLFFSVVGSFEAGGPDIFVWNVDTGADVTAPWAAASGDTSVVATNGAGADYDRATDAIVAWGGGAPALWNLTSNQWARGSGAGAPPTMVDNGTYGRFRYVPHLNAFVLVNLPDQNVYLYKHTAGCGPS